MAHDRNSVGPARAGLPDAPASSDDALREAGIDPDRLPIAYFGKPGAPHATDQAVRSPWARRLGIGLGLWLLLTTTQALGVPLPLIVQGLASLLVGLLIIQVACDALIVASERLAARLSLDHYVAGSLAEILATLPELVVVAFLIPVSPKAALLIVLITVYNNAFVFSIYSFFLPKDRRGRFLMPAPITEAGSQILVAGAAMGLALGLVMMAVLFGDHPKNSFAPADLISVGVLMLLIFGVYAFKLIRDYGREEVGVRDALELTSEQIERRRAVVYAPVHESSLALIAGYLAVGAAGAVLGGDQVADFAEIALKDLHVNPMVTALALAGFAGMSEYVILWQSHRKGEHGIGLANGFGGITQVLFLVLPFTMIAIGCYQAWINPGHPEFPLAFSLSIMLLLIFLFPMLYVLVALLEEDHTLGILDTTIMAAIFMLLIALLLSYGAHNL